MNVIQDVVALSGTIQEIMDAIKKYRSQGWRIVSMCPFATPIVTTNTNLILVLEAYVQNVKEDAPIQPSTN
jgi:hypothetical protein